MPLFGDEPHEEPHNISVQSKPCHMKIVLLVEDLHHPMHMHLHFYREYMITMYITIQNLQNMEKLKKIVATSENIEENNRVLQQLGIPPITTTLGGSNDSAQRQSRQASEEDSDYMPLKDEGPNNVAAATTKSSTIRTRELEIPPITTTLGGNNDSTQRQNRQASKEDGDYMPLKDEGPDNIAVAATKACRYLNNKDKSY
ncbi:hypothetical protein Cgig2_033192 [Carnegiea gigantea]|uniref:Uncharacterized protein n=1 Tax=Carnegiea gigantea TaxID=171969 RepID=A0A9Q1GRP3_9CARY|nr:hypothetical protein Cgig2_033192 [Carnegiea gigantea]